MLQRYVTYSYKTNLAVIVTTGTLSSLVLLLTKIPGYLGGYEKWQKAAASLDFPIIVSNYLETHTTDAQRKQGLDIADFL